MNPTSLRVRLLIAGVLAVALAFGVFAIGLVFLFQRHVERRVDSELNVHLIQLVAGLDRDAAGQIALVQPPAELRFERPFSGLYWQIRIEPQGTMLRSRSLWDTELALPRNGPADKAVHRHRLAGPDDATLYVLERRFELPARFEGASVRAAVALDADEIHIAMRDFVWDVVPLLLVMFTVLMGAAWAQVTVGLRPLGVIHERLTAIRSGNTERLGSGFPDEVRPLATEIDALLDARDTQIEKARARAAQLAHGLKTPLQVLAGEAERLEAKGEREIAAAVTSLATSMHRHVQRELMRARVAPDAVHARADVREIAERVVNVVRRTPNGRDLTWSIDVPSELRARINADDLAEMLGNLIENAARYARSRVGVLGRAERDCALVTVTDDGPGFPAERLAEALNGAGRIDGSSAGTGLGLTIVSDIAEAWGAGFSIEDEKPGVRASLRLRRA
jgi:signal transduction histidine kinase